MEERITSTGSGPKAFEYGPGPSIVYQSADSDGPLFLQDVATRSKRQVAACVVASAFCARPIGIFYVACNPAKPMLHLLDPNTGKDRVLGRLDGYSSNGSNTISASPDGSTIMFQHTGDSTPIDLYMIENFR